MRIRLQIDPSEWPEIWQATCRILESHIHQSLMVAWIFPLRFLGVESAEDGSARVTLIANNEFSAKWVLDHNKKRIEEALSQVTGSRCELIVKADGSASEGQARPLSMEPHEAPYEEGLVAQTNEPTAPVSGVVIHAGHRNPSTQLDQPDPRYDFASFVVGASNQFAHASAVAVAEQPGRQYNPLFIHAPPGLGKTHLLHAIGNHILARNPQARVAYLSAERFVNELIDSIQRQKMPQFRQKYRDSFDLLLIDDIHFIAGKTSSEEEFVHTFNSLHGSKRQIVLTSDRPPKEIEALEERIRTRFEWGLIADISPPEIETRIAILKAKAERDDIYLPDEVATFLASHIKSNVRELEGVLIKLQAQASLTGAEISLEMAKIELKTAIPEEGAHITVEAIQNAVIRHYQIKLADLKANSRAKAVAVPRQVAMYLVRKYTGMGYQEIGTFFGGRDHATVIHACNKIDAGVEAMAEIHDAVERIQNLL